MTDTSVTIDSAMETRHTDLPELAVQTRLVRAATEIFREQGYNAARVSDIVERAGVAQGTFYLYFKNKEAAFLFLIDDFFDRLMGETLGRFPASGLAGHEDLVRQLREMWGAILASCRREPDLAILVLRDALALGGDTRAQVEQRFADVTAATAAYFAEVSARGFIRTDISEPTAWAVVGMIERAIHYAVVVAPEADLEALVDEVLALELTGLFGGIVPGGPGGAAPPA